MTYREAFNTAMKDFWIWFVIWCVGVFMANDGFIKTDGLILAAALALACVAIVACEKRWLK